MTDEEKAKELTIKNVTDGKNKYFSWGFYKGCVVGLEYNNKQIAELKEKISVLLSCKNCPENKGGWICVKEYENKCLAQKIEFIKELKKENAQLKSKNCWKTCEYAEPKSQWISQHIQDVEQLTKAKEIIKDYMTIVKGSHTTVCGVPEENRTIYVLKLNEEAEQFIKE